MTIIWGQCRTTLSALTYIQSLLDGSAYSDQRVKYGRGASS